MTNAKYLEKLESYEKLKVIVGVLIIRVYVTNYGKYESTYQPLGIEHKNGRTFGKILLYGNVYYAEFVNNEWKVNTKYGLCRI